MKPTVKPHPHAENTELVPLGFFQGSNSKNLISLEDPDPRSIQAFPPAPRAFFLEPA